MTPDAADMLTVEDGRLTFWSIDGRRIDLGPTLLVPIDVLHKDIDKWLKAASDAGAAKVRVAELIQFKP